MEEKADKGELKARICYRRMSSARVRPEYAPLSLK